MIAGIMHQRKLFWHIENQCLHRPKFKTRAEARKVMFEYIEVFYYRIRRQVKLNNQIRDDFAKDCMEKLAQNVA